MVTMAFARQQTPTARGTWHPWARSLATAVQGRLPHALLFLCAAGVVAALIPATALVRAPETRGRSATRGAAAPVGEQ
ncbi:hypothetical protein ACWEWG_38265 [Streptomyces sp. NPDC003758]|uniref:Uncharacterized protein n=1 Tax=Streptomyces cynarae TaxID=2981134 RepID=A0ABY6EIW1_9ACTN|nr:hypothetical protein [Streptomyces cynarae]UXY23983.1 hypothetical protein N8I84_38735 [Streptomyces cynarae]